MAGFIQLRCPKLYRERVHTRAEDYHGLYRFNEENVEWKADHFLGVSNETRGGALSSKKRMKIFLRFVSDPGFQSGIGKDIGVHRTTVCKTVSFVLGKIMDKSHLWIKFPTSNTALNKARLEWAERYRFPCTIGVIDCTHVRITKPSHHGDEYINRKGGVSIYVQATCNAKEEFTSIDAQWPGSVHDSRILKRSDIYGAINSQQNDSLLLGDSGYGICPWLMTPYREPNTPQKEAYNALLKKERVIIERCFGQLKRRFPVLNHVRTKLYKVPAVIISCAVLHNIAKYLKDPDHPG